MIVFILLAALHPFIIVEDYRYLGAKPQSNTRVFRDGFRLIGFGWSLWMDWSKLGGSATSLLTLSVIKLGTLNEQ